MGLTEVDIDRAWSRLDLLPTPIARVVAPVISSSLSSDGSPEQVDALHKGAEQALRIFSLIVMAGMFDPGLKLPSSASASSVLSLSRAVEAMNLASFGGWISIAGALVKHLRMERLGVESCLDLEPLRRVLADRRFEPLSGLEPVGGPPRPWNALDALRELRNAVAHSTESPSTARCQAITSHYLPALLEVMEGVSPLADCEVVLRDPERACVRLVGRTPAPDLGDSMPRDANLAVRLPNGRWLRLWPLATVRERDDGWYNAHGLNQGVRYLGAGMNMWLEPGAVAGLTSRMDALRLIHDPMVRAKATVDEGIEQLGLDHRYSPRRQAEEAWVDRLLPWLRQIDGGSRALAIEGVAGTGKSWLALDLARRAWGFGAVAIVVRGAELGREQDALAKHLAAMAGSRDRKLGAAWSSLREALRSRGMQHTLFVLDALDEASDDVATELERLVQLVESSERVLVTSRPKTSTPWRRCPDTFHHWSGQPCLQLPVLIPSDPDARAIYEKGRDSGGCATPWDVLSTRQRESLCTPFSISLLHRACSGQAAPHGDLVEVTLMKALFERWPRVAGIARVVAQRMWETQSSSLPIEDAVKIESTSGEAVIRQLVDLRVLRRTGADGFAFAHDGIAGAVLAHLWQQDGQLTADAVARHVESVALTAASSVALEAAKRVAMSWLLEGQVVEAACLARRVPGVVQSAWTQAPSEVGVELVALLEPDEDAHVLRSLCETANVAAQWRMALIAAERRTVSRDARKRAAGHAEALGSAMNLLDEKRVEHHRNSLIPLLNVLDETERFSADLNVAIATSGIDGRAAAERFYRGMLKRWGEGDSWRAASVLTNLSAVVYEQGRADEASALVTAALSKMRGEGPMRRAAALRNQILYFLDAGRVEDALAAATEVTSAYAGAVDDGATCLTDDLVHAEILLGRAANAAGDHLYACQVIERALRRTLAVLHGESREDPQFGLVARDLVGVALDLPAESLEELVAVLPREPAPPAAEFVATFAVGAAQRPSSSSSSFRRSCIDLAVRGVARWEPSGNQSVREFRVELLSQVARLVDALSPDLSVEVHQRGLDAARQGGVRDQGYWVARFGHNLSVSAHERGEMAAAINLSCQARDALRPTRRTQLTMDKLRLLARVEHHLARLYLENGDRAQARRAAMNAGDARTYLVDSGCQEEAAYLEQVSNLLAEIDACDAENVESGRRSRRRKGKQQKKARRKNRKKK